MTVAVPDPAALIGDDRLVVDTQRALAAVYSTDRRYRYWFSQVVPGTGSTGICLFIMLNPASAADDFQPGSLVSTDMEADRRRRHPTRDRLEAWVQCSGCGVLETVNLFAFRSKSPAALQSVEDPVGPHNDQYIVSAARRATVIVAAWGNGGRLRNRGREVRRLLTSVGRTVHTLESLTKRGQPRHPLYVPKSALLSPWPPGPER